MCKVLIANCFYSIFLEKHFFISPTLVINCAVEFYCEEIVHLLF